MYKFYKKTAEVCPIDDEKTHEPELKEDKESQNGKGLLVVDIWEFYKRVLAFPANTAGIERKFGFGLYFFSLLSAIYFILRIYTEPTAYYTEGSVEFGEDIKIYRTPDIVICPNDWDDFEEYDYNVAFNEEAIQFLNISRHHLNLLSRLKFESCKDKTRCRNLEKPCDGDFKEYCAKISSDPHRFARIGLSRWHMNGTSYHYRVWLIENRKFTLETLWKLLWHHQFLEVSIMFQTNKMDCRNWFYDNQTECKEKSLQRWVGNTLCWFMPAEKVITESHNLSTVIMYSWTINPMYFGFWMGSLKFQSISSLQTLDLRDTTSGIAFSVTEFRNETNTQATCQEREIIGREPVTCSEPCGLDYPCYYEWHKSITNPKYWSNGIHLKLISKRRIEIKPLFSKYTKFQIAAGVFSSCVGHSIMQILYLSLQKLKTKVIFKSWAETTLISVVFLILVAGTIAMGRVDLKFYFENRYNVVFKEISQNLYPTVNFYSSAFDFLSNDDENISSEFQNYLRLVDSANMARTSLRNIASNETLENSKLFPFTLHNNSPELLQRFRDEARTLSQSLNFSSEASITQLIAAFSPDRRKFLQNCKIGNIQFDCHNYLRYYRTKENYLCFALDISSSAAEIQEESFNMVRKDTVLSFSIDFDVVYRNARSKGDLWLLWFLTLKHPSSLSSDETFFYGDAFDFFGFGIQNIGITPSFNHKLRSKNENNCVEEHERVCRRSPEEMYAILRAFQRNHWCGCVDCLWYGTIRDAMYNNIRSSSQIPLQCCTVTNLTGCFASYMMKFGAADNTSGWDKDQKEISTKFYDGIKFDLIHAAMKESNRTEFTQDELITIIEGYKDFPVSLQSRISEFTKQCFKKPCLKFVYDLSASNKKKKNDERYIEITINYKASRIIGVVEVDRFNFTDFFGVLMCSFSFIFGVGIVGMLEITFAYLSICGRTKRVSTFLLKEHLMRSVALFSNQKHEADVLPTKASQQNSLDDFVAEKRELSSADAMKELSSDGLFELKVEDLESNVTVSPDETQSIKSLDEESTTKYIGSSIKSSDKRADEQIASDLFQRFIKKRQENSGERREAIRAILMLGTLAVASSVMVFMTIDFFSSLEKNEYNTKVINNPDYQPPSIVACMANSTRTDLIFEENEKEGICRIYGIPGNMSCSSVFNVFFKNNENQSCYLYERIGNRKLDPGESDLEISWKHYEHGTISFLVYEPGSLQLREISPSADMRRPTLTVVYRFTRKRIRNHCTPGLKKSEKILRNCGAKDRQNGTACCVKSEYCNEPVTVPDSCLRYHFITENFYTYKKVRLIIKPALDFTIETTKKPKYDSLTIFSILGGIVGSFIELTLLNCLSLLFILVLQFVRIFKQ